MAQAYDPLDYTQFPQHNVRNVQASIATRQTGPAWCASYLFNVHLRKGGLQSVIMDTCPEQNDPPPFVL